MKTQSTSVIQLNPYSQIYSVMIILACLFLSSYIFIIKPYYSNSFTSWFAVVLFVIAIIFLIRNAVLKPKVIGKMEISNEAIKLLYEDNTRIFLLRDIDYVSIHGGGYGNLKPHSIFGNTDVLEIRTNANNICRVGLLFNGKDEKRNLKSSLYSSSISRKLNE